MANAPPSPPEVDPSTKLALRLRRFCPLLGRDFRPLRRKGLVAEAKELGQDVVHVGVGSV